MILRHLLSTDTPARSGDISFDDWLNLFAFNGNQYQLGSLTQTLAGAKQEVADGSFGQNMQLGYRSNGVVFACMLARFSLFSEARFAFRRMHNGRPGDYWGDARLGILERPWPNGNTGDLLTRMLVHGDLAGTAFPVRRNGTIQLVRPDWVDMLIGTDDESPWSTDAAPVGLIYYPGGRQAGKEPEVYIPGEFSYFAPTPDPSKRFLGMSWLAPIVREYAADSAARDHKLRFFENGATPNMVVKLDKDSAASQSTTAFEEWVDKFKKAEPKGRQSYKTMYLAAGADVTVVGSDLKQLDFKVSQGAGETRIAAAAGVPPVIVGLSEGLQAATYSNYGQARRRFADLTMRPLWRNAAGTLADLINVPSDSMLWYDDRDIPFLDEDRKDAAEVASLQAQTIKALVDAGYDPDSVTSAVDAEDWSLLKHSGLYSVQLQPPGTGDVAPAA